MNLSGATLFEYAPSAHGYLCQRCFRFDVHPSAGSQGTIKQGHDPRNPVLPIRRVDERDIKLPRRRGEEF